MSRYPDASSPYSIIRQGGFYAVHHAHFGVVLDEIETEGSAEYHIAGLEDGDAQAAEDEVAAEAEYAATHPDLKLVAPQPIYRIERRYDCKPNEQPRAFEIFDAEGAVADAGYEPTTSRWWVCADETRFPTLASLPALFEGRFDRWFDNLGDVFALFGADLPRVGEPVIRDTAVPALQQERAA